MTSILPGTTRFETPVYGTIFAGRAAVVRRLQQGDALILVPDPSPIDDPAAALDSGDDVLPAALVVREPQVWVHAQGGDVVGHLSPDINRWLVPLMLGGARYTAAVLSVGAPDCESWKRLVIQVRVLE